MEPDRVGARLEADHRAAAVLRRIAVRPSEAAGDGAAGADLRQQRPGVVQLVRPHVDHRRHAGRGAAPTGEGGAFGLHRAPEATNRCRRISTATRARVGRDDRAPCRAPSDSSTFNATLRANHGSWASWRPALRTRPVPDAAQVGPVDRHRSRSSDVPERRAEHQRPQDGQRDADRRERVVDEHRAAVGHPDPVVADVGERRRVAVGAVDVQHVDRVHDRRRGHRRRTSAGAAPGRRRRRVRGWRGTPRGRRRPPSAYPSNSWGPRSLPAWGSMAITSTSGAAAIASTMVERPRKLPISTIDPPAGQRVAES